MSVALAVPDQSSTKRLSAVNWRGRWLASDFSSFKFKGWLLLSIALTVLLAACGDNSAGTQGGSLSTTQTGAPVADGEPEIGFPIRMYTGESVVGGAEIHFADLHGQPIVLNFWAGLCPPCRAEMPDLQDFYNQRHEDVLLIGIDVGQFTGLGSQEDAINLLNSLEITYPTGFTTDGTVIKEFGVFSMPTTLFITADGEEFRKWSGALNSDKLVEITDEMLAAG